MFEYWQEELHIKFIVAENVFFFQVIDGDHIRVDPYWVILIKEMSAIFYIIFLFLSISYDGGH